MYYATMEVKPGNTEYCMMDIVIYSLTERSYYNTAIEKPWLIIPPYYRDKMHNSSLHSVEYNIFAVAWYL